MTALDRKVYDVLAAIPDCYCYFLDGVFGDVRGDAEKEKELLRFLKEHPEANSSDVLTFELRSGWLDDEYDEDPDCGFLIDPSELDTRYSWEMDPSELPDE